MTNFSVTNDVDSCVVVQINELINLNTSFKFRLLETFSRYQPRPRLVLPAGSDVILWDNLINPTKTRVDEN